MTIEKRLDELVVEIEDIKIKQKELVKINDEIQSLIEMMEQQLNQHIIQVPEQIKLSEGELLGIYGLMKKPSETIHYEQFSNEPRVP
ncbi:hypothetical protein OQJ18_00015 [Fluoribacter dumoffii]|uniref:hypothetical protein n=1 Tax=Fluoribacter dumoffii TaxID=463 RepID=UPI0022441F96|nr:hypothetical protein [Fluoribacter dumoffii]MCW8386448.1 hypothetical protein [Fluoribacter dumoffii]MCW8419501.1 hypothetical protein [Fluoribacter dumoffii]MCW8452624.1 hypothetical protein [Fluoribacter dumoffii]MCW8460125.1 hypothetical protein [Fluoribacter dumoffii]MCW8483604.1 hypothetical protein [Fluoribacter dumoffii]